MRRSGGVRRHPGLARKSRARNLDGSSWRENRARIAIARSLRCLTRTEIRNFDRGGDRKVVTRTLIAEAGLNRKGVAGRQLNRARALCHRNSVLFADPPARPAKAIYDLAAVAGPRTILRQRGKGPPFSALGLLRNFKIRPESDHTPPVRGAAQFVPFMLPALRSANAGPGRIGHRQEADGKVCPALLVTVPPGIGVQVDAAHRAKS